jgi:hypothetical protein
MLTNWGNIKQSKSVTWNLMKCIKTQFFSCGVCSYCYLNLNFSWTPHCSYPFVVNVVADLTTFPMAGLLCYFITKDKIKCWLKICYFIYCWYKCFNIKMVFLILGRSSTHCPVQGNNQIIINMFKKFLILSSNLKYFFFNQSSFLHKTFLGDGIA